MVRDQGVKSLRFLIWVTSRSLDNPRGDYERETLKWKGGRSLI